MRVVDTSIWIEVFAATELGKAQLGLLEVPEEIIVPTMVQFEIYKWLSRARSTEEANQAITFTDGCHVEPLSTAIAVLAAELSVRHKLHATDAIIYATAQMHESALLTCDAHFKDLPDVEYFEKR